MALGSVGTVVTGSLALGGAASVDLLGVPRDHLEVMAPRELTVEPDAIGAHALGGHTVEIGRASCRERV